MTPPHRFSSARPARAALVTAPVLALAVLVAVLAGPAHAATGYSCTKAVSAGERSGIYLRASDMFAQRLTCSRARTVVGAYMRTKISDQTCAAQAENGGRGCRVDGYRCHSTGRVHMSHGQAIHPELCTQADRRITFMEADSDNG